jgi:hypothetical protein
MAIEAALLTGGEDRHYAFGLSMALVSRGISLDVVGSDEVDSPEMHVSPQLRFLNLRGNQRPDAGVWRKLWRVAIYYLRLIGYAATARPKIFHILWNNKFQVFDRTLLTLYYKLLGKKIVLTAHNVNAGRRDQADSLQPAFVEDAVSPRRAYLRSHRQDEDPARSGVRRSSAPGDRHPVRDQQRPP